MRRDRICGHLERVELGLLIRRWCELFAMWLGKSGGWGHFGENTLILRYVEVRSAPRDRASVHSCHTDELRGIIESPLSVTTGAAGTPKMSGSNSCWPSHRRRQTDQTRFHRRSRLPKASNHKLRISAHPTQRASFAGSPRSWALISLPERTHNMHRNTAPGSAKHPAVSLPLRIPTDHSKKNMSYISQFGRSAGTIVYVFLIQFQKCCLTFSATSSRRVASK